MSKKHQSSSLFKPFLTVCCLLLQKLKLAGGPHNHSGMPAAQNTSPSSPSAPPSDALRGRTLVVDVEGCLLRSPVSAFPFFMLAAVEAGGFFRGLILLLLYPLMCLGSEDVRTRAMATVALVGLEEKEVARVGKAVQPKFFLEATTVEGVEAVRAARRVVAVSTTFPRVMVEGFLRQYVGVDAVMRLEMWSVPSGVLTGLMGKEDTTKVVRRRLQELFGTDTVNMTRKVGDAVGLFGTGRSNRAHYLFSHYYCKETFAVGEAEKSGWRPLPPDKYPKPLVFHDGRLAFLPTPAAALAMYVYLPFAIALAVVRAIAFSVLPYRVFMPVAALTGMQNRLIDGQVDGAAASPHDAGRLYVCNHRTLVDVLVVAVAAVGRPVTALSYGVSPVSEMLASMRSARLTRDREEDRRAMAALLARGDVVMCPEGTTCRERYLLRFSPLFAELGADVIPVALDARLDMFYPTSSNPGIKWMDPFYFALNPRPAYWVEFLPRAMDASAENGGSIDVANRAQREIGEALGFEVTRLTRKDKYMMLAGDEGVVPTAPNI